MTVVAAYLYRDGHRIRPVAIDERADCATGMSEYVWIGIGSLGKCIERRLVPNEPGVAERVLKATLAMASPRGLVIANIVDGTVGTSRHCASYDLVWVVHKQLHSRCCAFASSGAREPHRRLVKKEGCPIDR